MASLCGRTSSQHFLSPLLDLGWAHASTVLKGGKQLSCYNVYCTTVHTGLEIEY